MVDMKELRIGNYLMIDGTALPIGAGWFCLADRPHSIPEHKAIPITPEWLERMGFVKNRIGDYGIGNTFVFPYTNPGEWFVTFSPDKGGTAVRYVHQLQNIYYAMIGKELEIKETV